MKAVLSRIAMIVICALPICAIYTYSDDKSEREKVLQAEKEMTLRCLRASDKSSDPVLAAESCATMQYSTSIVHYGIKVVLQGTQTNEQKQKITNLFYKRLSEIVMLKEKK